MDFALVYGHGSPEAQFALYFAAAVGLVLGLIARRNRRLGVLWLAFPLALLHAGYWIWSPENDFASLPLGFRINHSALSLLRAAPMPAAFVGAMLWLESRTWARQLYVRVVASVGVAVCVRAIQFWLGLAW